MGKGYGLGLFSGTIGSGGSTPTTTGSETQSSSANSKRDALLAEVQNPALRETISQLYRTGAEFGDGGTADAIRHERETGETVGGRSHIIKGEQSIRRLKRILRSEKLTATEKQIATDLLNDLLDALGRTR